jgi:methionyl-tRNA formyltransferase
VYYPAVRVVLFGSGSPLALAALDVLTSEDVLAVVVPAPRGGHGLRIGLRQLLAWSSHRSFVSHVRRAHVPVLSYDPSRRAELERRLAALRPDVLCVASFPYLLPPSLLAVARAGGINLHFSLLPRHRGPDPLVWTYLHDDRETGVTVHWIDAGADTGDIIAQQAMPLARGRAIRDLYMDLISPGKRLLATTLTALSRATATRIPQDDARATHEGMPREPWRHVDLASWPAERVWHVLAGLGGTGLSLIPGRRGPVWHGPARSYRLETHGRSPGTVEQVKSGWHVYCHDGIVDVARPPMAKRLATAARRVAGRVGRLGR